ncbi:MAG: T9SS type A sorting domain-containing protein [Bacteroidetes bacterium]|nr:T9SS type A sorting domain-containing protein [Bacteroidota bacterium]
MKRNAFLSLILLLAINFCYGQTTVTSGNWSDPTVWSGSTVPLPGGTVVVNNPLTIDASLSPTGAMTFNSNTTDQPGGTAYTFNPNAGTNSINISAGAIVTFEGGTSGSPNSFNGGTLNIYGTLILGYTQINNSANMNIVVHPGGTLIINGNLINKNNSGTFTVDGTLIVNGNFDNQTGSITVGGTGSISTTGSLTSGGGSTIFGTPNDCTTGPCSGTTLSCTFTNTITPVSKTICNGSSVTLTSNNSASSPTYQWQSSIDNISYSDISGATSNNYVTPPLTQSTWYRVKVSSSSGPCTSISAPTKITVLTWGGWLGGTSNDWGTASNWCSNTVPTSTTDVTITNASGIAHMPTIKAGTAASCKNLTISNTYPISSLTIAASATASLSISGDFTNNGSFTDNSTAATAGVKLVGSIAQYISGTTDNVFNNLIINNSSGANPSITINNNNVAINNNLTLSAGMINLSGYSITLGTSAANPGKLIFTSGAWFYGGNIQRWFPTTSITLGSAASLFPIGTATDYRPIYFGSTGGLTSGGTVKASHTGITGTSTVSFSDAGTPLQVRSNSYWNVTTANGLSGSGSPFTIRTEGTGLGTVGSVTDLRLTLATAAAPGAPGANSGTTTNPQVNRTSFPVSGLSNSFYSASINSTQTPLPIVLESFTAQQVAEQVNLNWETSAETNFSYFSIERSNDGSQFTEIGTVYYTNSADLVHQFGYADLSPLIGNNYYRLKLVDLDGTYKYSNIVWVQYLEKKKMTIFPNPLIGKSLSMKINFQVNSPYSLSIYDSQGKLMETYASDQAQLTINLPKTITAGIYYVKFTSHAFSALSSFMVNK